MLYLGKVLLDKRQKPKDAVTQWYQAPADNNRYKPHEGKKQVQKAIKRNGGKTD